MNQSRLASYLALGVGILCLGFSGIFVRWVDAPGPVVSLAQVAAIASVLYRRVLGMLKRPWI